MRRAACLLALVSVFGLLLATVPTASADGGKWLARTRLIYIAPNDNADGALGTLNTQVESDFTVEVDGTYFFTPRIALEGILATAAQEITVNGGQDSLGSVYHAPATFLVQYHFIPEGNTRPYIGLGINYTIFYSESGQLADNFKLDSGSFGYGGQAGVDFMIDDNLLFNIDLKYVTIESTVEDLAGTDLGTVEVNPLVVGVGFGYRF